MSIFAVDMPTNISTSNNKFEQNHFKRSQDMRLQKLAKFVFSYVFFFLTSHTYKNMNATSDCLEIRYAEGGYKGAIWYQVWLEYDKQSRSY